MSLASNLLVALAGLLSGGVANVLADDLPQRQAPHQPHCPHCGHPRRLAGWLGVGALVAGQRHCEACAQPLSWRHPALEIVLAGAFVYLWNRYGLTVDCLFVMAYVWLAALVAVIDLEHRLVLNVIMGPAILLALIEAALTPRLPFVSALAGGLTGFGVVFGIFLLGEAFRRIVARLRGETIEEVAFGFGDVTLATFGGLVVGGGRGVSLMLTLMVVAGGVVALLFLVYRRFLRRDYSVFTAIPYGPNILFGMLVVLIWREDFGAAMRRLLFGG